MRFPATIVLVVLLAGCAQRSDVSTPAARDTVASSVPGSPQPAPADTLLPVGLALKDDGRTIQVAPGRVVLVSLKANHTSGYHWTLADSALGALAREGEPAYHADSTSGVGADGFEIWRFRAIRPGRGAIVLAYRRSWETDEPAETAVHYTVEVR